MEYLKILLHHIYIYIYPSVSDEISRLDQRNSLIGRELTLSHTSPRYKSRIKSGQNLMNIPANVLTPLSRQSVFNNKRFADLYARLCEIVLKLSREREKEKEKGEREER